MPDYSFSSSENPNQSIHKQEQSLENEIEEEEKVPGKDTKDTQLDQN